nr:uncharacterized protein LOC109738252 [Aegilops tauschii subsp. strangulata]
MIEREVAGHGPCPGRTTSLEADLDAAGLWEAVVPPEDAASAVIAKKDKPVWAYLLRALADDLLLQVAAKKTAAEIWSSLKARFVGADCVRAARLGTLRSEFELLRMDGGESLDAFAGKISGMAARYAGLGSTLDDAATVKKLLDCVSDCLYAAVAGMEQFCDLLTLLFEDALGRLKAFDERLRQRGQAASCCTRRCNGGRGSSVKAERGTTTTCAAKLPFGGNRRGRCYKCGQREHFKRDCPQLKKAPAAERALLVDDVVEDAGLF